MKKISKVWYLVVALVVLGVAAYFLGKPDTKETISFDTATVGQTNIQNSITATGTIEPVTSVTVGTQVSGIVSKLYVDYNSVVKKRTGDRRTRQDQPPLGPQPGQGNA